MHVVHACVHVHHKDKQLHMTTLTDDLYLTEGIVGGVADAGAGYETQGDSAHCRVVVELGHIDEVVL